MSGASLYDDGSVSCDEDGIRIARYYPWGAKRISYSSISDVRELPLTGVNAVRRWRIWGSGDFVHWWNLDVKRPSKTAALVLDVGKRVLPTITPDDPAAVERILSERRNR